MRAIEMYAHRGVDGLRLAEVPPPEPGPGDLLIQVKAAGVNPVDWKIAQGLGKDNFGHALPVVAGCELAGTVAAVGDGVDPAYVGRHLFGFVDLARLGAFAELAIGRPDEFAEKPETLSFVEAAAVPVGALTAWQGMFEHGSLERGQTVLIHAASGGVGSLAVQLAREAGARVIGTASGANEAFVRSLGVDEFINYRETAFDEVLQDLDLVFDAVGGETQARSFKCLRPSGRLVSIVAPPSAELALEHGVQAGFTAVAPHREQLERIARLIDGGRLRPTIAASFPLEQTVEALRKSQAGRTRGKLVVTPG